ncbi:uncharacterized protein C12orf42 homolog [Perognathus longimembris pacificus]|uniref:uncharacterized protein C12orf42 homolog n=1 Tax=Perognathus longimembris pacificus TaxID=214514 RepID=UPI00201A0048|nr:uncharacterized protein C12orf42 homolog [Perognathus longimembris pacificus]
MEKPLCYVPIVSSATLWERNIPHTTPSPHHGRTPLPCTRFITHMKNFSDSYKFSNLRFLQFPERTRGPIACKRLITASQYIMPGLTENIDCLDEEIYGRACPSPTPSNEMDETPSSAGKNKKQTKENPKKAWSSPYLESQMANKHVRPLSTKPIHLEASGRHLSLHKQPLSNSKGDTALQQRPFTAIGLCGKKQAHGIQEASRRSVSEPKLEESTAATDDDADAYWDLQSRNLLVATGHALGKVKVATAPEKLAKHTQHHYLPEEGRPKADGPLPSNLAIAPLPVLQGGACTHFPSKRLIKVCSSAPPRTPRGFHKACSQALRRPVVNAVMNAHLH